MDENNSGKLILTGRWQCSWRRSWARRRWPASPLTWTSTPWGTIQLLTGRVLRDREYWMIYRGPGFLAVLWFGSTSTPSLPSSVSMIHLRHTGRQKKRDNQRDKRGVAPQLTVETEVNGGRKKYKWRGPSLVGSLGFSFFTAKQKLVCLSRSLFIS